MDEIRRVPGPLIIELATTSRFISDTPQFEGFRSLPDRTTQQDQRNVIGITTYNNGHGAQEIRLCKRLVRTEIGGGVMEIAIGLALLAIVYSPLFRDAHGRSSAQ